MNKDLANVYITSDLHFFHKNIIKYCSRPYDMNDEGLEQMNNDIIKEFDKLPPNSVVINNGDICLSSNISFYRLKSIVDRMKANNKKLILIMGNHDREIHKYITKDEKFSDSKEFLEALGFDMVFDSPMAIENYILSHKPIYISPGSNVINIYGHTHDIDIDENYFNRDCENWAMMERVKEECITEQKNLDIDTSIKDKGLKIDKSNYINSCWDKHHRIIPLTEIIA